MKSIVTILGARPQFVKAKLISDEIRKWYKETIIHTGQHYDENMSDVFFNELNIPKPNYNLGIGSGSHAQQTGQIMETLEKLLLLIKPDMVLVYGDTNSTLAGALTAAKLHIPIAHVEAGLRSFNRTMPEEINRIVTDHLSDLLFAPTGTAIGNLGIEGLSAKSFITGDIMYDCIKYYSRNIEETDNNYYLATVHRPSNTDNEENFKQILRALNSLNKKVIFPAHPRIKHLIKGFWSNIQFTEPASYLSMIKLLKNSYKVITDSGGLQKEAYILNKQCITLREDTEWIETLHGNWNTLVGNNTDKILHAISKSTVGDTRSIFGKGDAAQIMVQYIKEYLS